MTSPTWKLPPEVVAAIESGRTIEAIKLLRQSTGIGLVEAKEAVDQYVRSQKLPGAASAPETSGETSLPPDVMQAVRSGNKIEAVRLVREYRGLGLREAKLLVDSLAANEPTPSGNLSPGMPRKSSGLLWLALLLIVAAYFVYRISGGG